MNEWPTLDNTCSNRYQVCAKVDTVKSQYIHSARDNIAELYELHRFESAVERVEFIDSLLVDKTYLFPVGERVEGDVSGPNLTQSESKADNEWLAPALFPGGCNPAGYVHRIVSSGE